MAKLDFLVGAANKRNLMTDGISIRYYGESIAVTAIQASDKYKAYARRHGDGNWFPSQVETFEQPALTPDGITTLTIDGTEIAKQIILQGIAVNIAGTIVPGTSTVSVEDEDGNVYWIVDAAAGESFFDFDEGLKINKVDLDAPEDGGNFIIVIRGVDDETNSITLSGWKI